MNQFFLKVLRTCVLDKNLSQFAAETGVSHVSVIRYESGKREIPQEYAQLVCQTYQIDNESYGAIEELVSDLDRIRRKLINAPL